MGRVGAQVLRIAGEEISPDYLTREELGSYADDPDRHLYVYDLAVDEPVVELEDADALDDDGVVVGFALTGVYDRESYADIVDVPVEAILARTPLTEEDFPLSQFKVMAVDDEHKGKGIGSAMSATALVPLFENPPVTAMLWERDNPANVKLAERYANNRLVRFQNYFHDDWRCPVCGFGNACECAVTMYGWFADGRRNLTTAD